MTYATSIPTTAFGKFIAGQSKAILFLTLCLSFAGILAARTMPSSVFPQTNFPRVVILIDNGVMPADQMMATITRPIEEAMKDIPGVVSIRTGTGRGSAEVNVFFDWSVDMKQSELYVLGRLAQIRATLPPTATTNVYRMTFSAFPILGLSLTSSTDRSQTELWSLARYNVKPRLIRVRGVARVDIVGGRIPEYHVRIDPARLEAYKLSLGEVSDALRKGSLIADAGMHDEEHQLYLTLVDGRVATASDIAELVVAQADSGPVRVKDFAEIVAGQEPDFKIVSADGRRAVLLNVRSQPDGSTLNIKADIEHELEQLRQELPPDVKIAFFYDQSLLVQDAVGGVWESVFFGLLLSVAIMFAFLKSGQSWFATARTTLIAIVVIPVAILAALVAMKALGLSFNLMTLGGIAAAVGLVIDDAIVVVEAITAHITSGLSPIHAVEAAAGEVIVPLVGSTLTPVVVFIPLAFIDGIQGVFFRSLAITMVVSLLTSLVLAMTLTPTLVARFAKSSPAEPHPSNHDHHEHAGPILRLLIALYERLARVALRHSVATVTLSMMTLLGAWGLYQHLKSDFLPEMDEGAFVMDYRMPPGTALSETDRVLRHVEKLLAETPEVESYSRRTGARLALALAAPHFGDFLVKLKKDRSRSVEEIKDDLRKRIEEAEPALKISLAGILGDLITDLMWAPAPIEIKVFSPDVAKLKEIAPKIAEAIEDKDGKGIAGVVDVNDGLVYTGSAQIYRLNWPELPRYGIKSDDAARTLNIALLGEAPASVLEGDRLIPVRVVVDPKFVRDAAQIESLLVRSELGGAGTRLSAIAQRRREAGQLELRREDLRQYVAVGARTNDRDLGSAVRDIREKLDRELPDRLGYSIEYGGLYQQQQESFRNLTLVLVLALVLVFLVLLIEFRSLLAPLAIVWGSLLSLFGVTLALWLTDTPLNIISFLGAIIGLGIVAKNGILMLDRVEHLRETGLSLAEALIQSGRRRLRPVLMTSLAAALGMLPIVLGEGTGNQMLRPLAIAVMGALAISVLLSLIATPATYFLLMRLTRNDSSPSPQQAPLS